jgi:hypothetical protein
MGCCRCVNGEAHCVAVITRDCRNDDLVMIEEFCVV